jgi:hypothetical protein
MVKFQAVSDTQVKVMDDNGKPSGLVFEKTAGQWLVRLPDEAMTQIQQIFTSQNEPAIERIVVAVEDAINAVAASVEDGSITEANFANKAGEVVQQKIMPRMGDVMMLMGPLMTPKPPAPGTPPSVTPGPFPASPGPAPASPTPSPYPAPTTPSPVPPFTTPAPGNTTNMTPGIATPVGQTIAPTLPMP